MRRRTGGAGVPAALPGEESGGAVQQLRHQQLRGQRHLQLHQLCRLRRHRVQQGIEDPEQSLWIRIRSDPELFHGSGIICTRYGRNDFISNFRPVDSGMYVVLVLYYRTVV